MSSSLILSITTYLYGMAAFLYIIAWIFRKNAIGRIAFLAATIGLLGNLAGFGLRWTESYQMGFGRAPLSNLYESLVFFALAIVALYLVVEKRHGHQTMGAFVMPIAFLCMAYASLSPNISDRIQPLLPALKSNWLIAHVVTCFIGYAGFAVAFCLSLMVLVCRNKKEGRESIWSKIPEPHLLDDLTHKMVMLGFLFLTAGIITGAVWANSAWGRYWGWDPKETWSLITWFIYATLLHARLMRGWRGRRTAVFSIAGFGAVLFTYLGVNLLPGLHSYGSM
ncbi:c-type cytochrome biogenesis protein CcsB [Desulfosarcina alkanivorans]|uniref:C-type cytochrome biogenesis protein CcsB n=1 Tax=Desulfosarcina alkanivorans TaxID=571177 RepID=A0A5K7YIN8_9BACT|nr:c-type cytochrome biogenesis protein CcsB [Desulfosarcina alkanivorans]BBO67960.1 c-type cytochrome biogenesis protein CcsB [Desulfosarcina alkanivorans]